MRADRDTRQKQFGAVIHAMAVFCVILFLNFDALVNPQFGGDAATRLDQADTLIIANPWRAYLPWVQTHVFLLWKLHAPLWAYPAISAFYVLVFLIAINRTYRTVSGDRRIASAPSLVFSLAMFLFLSIAHLRFLSFDIYQEIPCLAVLALVFMREAEGKPSWLFWFVGMLVREYVWVFWACYLVLIARRRRITTRSFSAITLISLIPIVWRVWFGAITLPGPLVDGKYDIGLATVVNVLDRLDTIMRVQKIWPLVTLTAGAAVLNLFFQIGSQRPSRAATFLNVFSTAAFITMAYIVLIDPQRVTPHNPRQVFPVLMAVPYAILYLISKSRDVSRPLRLLGCAVMIGCLILPASFSGRLPTNPRLAFYGEISESADKSEKEGRPVCVSGLDYWEQYMRFLVGPLRHARRVFLRAQPPPDGACSLVIGQAEDGYRRLSSVTLPDSKSVGIFEPFQETTNVS